jgi:hypothetical protein
MQRGFFLLAAMLGPSAMAQVPPNKATPKMKKARQAERPCKGISGSALTCKRQTGVAKRTANREGAEMISIVRNETQKAIEIHLDAKDADLLIKKLEHLKSVAGHLHLYATNNRWR